MEGNANTASCSLAWELDMAATGPAQHMRGLDFVHCWACGERSARIRDETTSESHSSDWNDAKLAETLVHSSKRGKPEAWLLGRWGVALAANREGRYSLILPSAC